MQLNFYEMFLNYVPILHLIRVMVGGSKCICKDPNSHTLLWDTLFTVVLLVLSCQIKMTLQCGICAIIY